MLPGRGFLQDLVHDILHWLVVLTQKLLKITHGNPIEGKLQSEILRLRLRCKRTVTLRAKIGQADNTLCCALPHFVIAGVGAGRRIVCSTLTFAGVLEPGLDVEEKVTPDELR
jgi:hypothetical protein